MVKKKRVRKNKQRGMHHKMITGKKPMTKEQKVERKAQRESQREAAKKAIRKPVEKKE